MLPSLLRPNALHAHRIEHDDATTTAAGRALPHAATTFEDGCVRVVCFPPKRPD
jgi:hypothetical protein